MFEKLYRIWKNGLIFEEINKILEKQILFWKKRSDFGRNGAHFRIMDQDLEELIRVWKKGSMF